MKIIVCLMAIMFFYLILGNVSALVIPEDALRIRVIPHSNDEDDVEIKNDVKEILENDIYSLLKDVEDVNEAKNIILDNINYFESSVSDLFDLNEYNLDFSINYGLNYFPAKEYKGVIYNEGYYESLVVTIGEGLGDNWWCVLFPPLCLIEDDKSEIEYTTYVQELVEKYFD